MTSTNIRAAWRVTFVGAVAGALLALGISAAWATAWSDEKRFTSNGVSYGNESYIETTSYAGTRLHRYSHGNASEGKMGARARVYWSNGVLCNDTIMRYNTQPTNHIATNFDSNCGGYIFARGRTASWNGNGYDLQSTYRTPNVAG